MKTPLTKQQDTCEGCGGPGAIYDGLCPRCDACPPWIDINDHDEECCGHGILLCEYCPDCDCERYDEEHDCGEDTCVEQLW